MSLLSDVLAGKLAEFIGGPMDGDRCELPGWALMHDGSIAVPAQTPEILFNRELNLADLNVALYRPDAEVICGDNPAFRVKLTSDGQALRYLYQAPDDMG